MSNKITFKVLIRDLFRTTSLSYPNEKVRDAIHIFRNKIFNA